VRIVCAPDSFKESMTALEAARAMAEGVRRVLPDAVCDLVPMADGGEGTVQALIDGLGGELVEAPCHDPLGRDIMASYGYVESRRLAVVEMAAASGLGLVPPEERDVLTASSSGTGELIMDALDRGARHFIIGVGGSATNDAGSGLFTALGVRFLDMQGEELPPGGGALQRLASIDASGLDPRLAACEIDVACDVDNPLLGESGATAVFGPQKGATTPDILGQLEDGLTRWADVVEASLHRIIRDVPGAGAGGGLGAALMAFLPQSRFRPGVEIVASTVALQQHIDGADLVLTGEGSIDAQTLRGKTLMGVLACARQAAVPIIMFGGRVEPEASVLLQHGVTNLVCIAVPGQPLPDALRAGPQNLATAVATTLRTIRP